MTKRKEPGGISQVVNEIHRPVLGKEGGQEKAVKVEERKVAEANLDHRDPSPDPSLDQSPDQSLRNVVVVDLNLEVAVAVPKVGRATSIIPKMNKKMLRRRPGESCCRTYFILCLKLPLPAS